MIGIINAMEIENNSVLSLCKDIKERTISGKKFYEATLAGEKVYLETYVKTIKNWRDKEKYLQEFGFNDFE